jgi:hypothetical protein
MITKKDNTSTKQPGATLDAIGLWVLFNTWAALSGWTLSMCGMLSGTGYLLALIPLLTGAILWRRPLASTLTNAVSTFRRFARLRMKQPLPALFAITIVAAAIGGILYTPNNYDFLTYRFARMLHWWNAGHWHWIHTANFRQNISGTGIEWTMMPSLILTHSSRLFFLLNVVSYLLMPGLVFSMLTQLGIGRRTSWFWMWILPSAYGYVVTAGSVGNDMFGTVLMLTALHFALRATRRGGITDLWLGCLAAGLMTAVKASNLPLWLPFLAAARPALPLIRTRWIQTLGIACVAIAISFAPTAALNHIYAGGWSGDPTNQEKVQASSPRVALLGNGMQLAMGCIAPPVIPQAASWTAQIQPWIPPSLRAQLKKEFPRFSLQFRDLGNEEHVGLGCGVSLLLATAAGVALFSRRRQSSQHRRWSVLGAGIIALAAFCSMMAAESTARLLAPYYPLVIASVLALPGTDRVTYMRWWRMLALLVGLSAVLLVILTPSRPLWPAKTVTTALRARNSESRLLKRISSVYSVYGDRADVLAPARALLPAHVHIVGLIQSGDDPEVALWRPFGQRQVTSVIGPEMMNRQWLNRMGIQAIVARRSIVEQQCGSMEAWLATIDGSLIKSIRLTLKVSEGNQEWLIVKLNPPPPATTEHP